MSTGQAKANALWCNDAMSLKSYARQSLHAIWASFEDIRKADANERDVKLLGGAGVWQGTVKILNSDSLSAMQSLHAILAFFETIVEADANERNPQLFEEDKNFARQFLCAQGSAVANHPVDSRGQQMVRAMLMVSACRQIQPQRR